MSHPDENELAALSEGKVPEAQAAVLRAHIEGCDDCRQALALAASGTGQVQSERLRRGESVGRYVVLGLLGSGSMGEVYTAFDPELDRKVALKLLRSREREAGAERLLAEAKAMARLAHPNVVVVHDAGQFDGRVFLAMELVEGQPVSDWLSQPRTLEEVLTVFCALGEGLDAAHRAGVVHRDFKPANALLGKDGRARVGDFGLALTGPGRSEVAGTLLFLAPEVLEGKPADARSDQFSFCVALRQATQGKTVPKWLDAALVRGTAKDPGERFGSMHELVAELRRSRQKAGRWAIGIAVALVALLGGIRFERAADPRRCRDALGRVNDLWNQAVKTSVAAAFAQTQLPFASEAAKGVSEVLDRWKETWTKAALTTCQDKEGLGEANRARRTLCLEARLEEAQALVTVLSHPESETVAHAADAARELTSVESCLVAHPVEERADPRALASAQAQVAQAKVLFDAGNHAKALVRAQEAARSAAALHSTSLTAQAQLVLGTVLASEGDDPAARTAFFEAAVAATAAGEDALAMRAWGRHAVLVAEREPKVHAGESWGRLAQAALERAGPDPLLSAELDDFLLSVARAEARTGDALELATSCLEKREKVLGPEHPLVGRSLMLKGMALHGVGRTAEAAPLLERARAITERAYGSKHPEVARVSSGQGLIALRLWQLGAAKQHYAESLELSSALGPGGSAVASALDSLGGVEMLLGQMAAAREHLERALELKRALPRADHPSLASTLLSLADLELATGAPEKSLALAREADTMLEALLGPSHGVRLRPQAAVAVACRALGQLDCAAESVKRMREVVEAGASGAKPVLLREEGELALARGKAEDALIAFRAAAELKPGFEEDVRVGRALLAAGRKQEAAVELARAVEALEKVDDPPALEAARRLLAGATVSKR